MEKVFDILGVISRVLIIIILTITTLLSMGTAYIMFAPDQLPKPFRLVYDFNPVPTPEPTVEAPKEVVVQPGQGILVTTGTKIININGTSGNKYIRVSISLEFNPPDPTYADMTADAKTTYTSEFTTEITGMMPVIDDTIITTISLKTFDDLYTAQGKEQLRQELLGKLNNRLPDQKVISVYFTEFVIN